MVENGKYGGDWPVCSYTHRIWRVLLAANLAIGLLLIASTSDATPPMIPIRCPATVEWIDYVHDSQQEYSADRFCDPANGACPHYAPQISASKWLLANSYVNGFQATVDLFDTTANHDFLREVRTTNFNPPSAIHTSGLVGCPRRQWAGSGVRERKP